MFQFTGFPSCTYGFSTRWQRITTAGFPHSEICGSTFICNYPQLIAACHVLLRLLMPRHSPYALISLILWYLYHWSILKICFVSSQLLAKLFFNFTLKVWFLSFWLFSTFLQSKNFVFAYYIVFNVLVALTKAQEICIQTECASFLWFRFTP